MLINLISTSDCDDCVLQKISNSEEIFIYSLSESIISDDESSDIIITSSVLTPVFLNSSYFSYFFYFTYTIFFLLYLSVINISYIY